MWMNCNILCRNILFRHGVLLAAANASVGADGQQSISQLGQNDPQQIDLIL